MLICYPNFKTANKQSLSCHIHICFLSSNWNMLCWWLLLLLGLHDCFYEYLLIYIFFNNLMNLHIIATDADIFFQNPVFKNSETPEFIKCIKSSTDWICVAGFPPFSPQLAVIFSVEQLLSQLQQVLETHEVNWKHVLCFLSTLLVYNPLAQPALKGKPKQTMWRVPLICITLQELYVFSFRNKGFCFRTTKLLFCIRQNCCPSCWHLRLQAMTWRTW